MLKTNLKTLEEINAIAPILSLHPAVYSWNVDIEDIDNVLRIESKKGLIENQVISLLSEYGVQSEILNY